MEIPFPHRKHNSTKERVEPIRLIVHLVAHPVGELAQRLREYAAQRLSAHKVPVDFIAVDSLPKNALGKVEHRLLQERHALSSVGAEWGRWSGGLVPARGVGPAQGDAIK